MKKRILSIALVIVIMLGALPSLVVSANPEVNTLIDYNTYRTVLTAETIDVDGDLDEIYKNAQKISGSDTGVSFEAYTAVTLRGVYVWAEIKDETLDKELSVGADSLDKFEIYIKMYDGYDLSWGWYDTDYNGKILRHEVMDADDLELEIAGGCSYSTLALAEARYACVKLADGSGWRSETFIPFAIETEGLGGYEISIGLQANNGTYVCYDKSDIRYAWFRYDAYTPLRLIAMDDTPACENLGKMAIYTHGIEVDGKRDEFYSEQAKVVLYTSRMHVDHEYRRDYGSVYLAFDDEYLYVYYERYDEDLIVEKVVEEGEEASEEDIDTLVTYYQFENNGDVKCGYFSIKIEPGQKGSFTHTSGQHNGWPGTTVAGLRIRTAAVEGKENTYGVEYRLPLPAGEKEELAQKGNASFKLAFSTGDFCSDEMHKNVDSANGKYRYCALAGCVSNANDFWLYSNSSNGEILPTIQLYKGFVEDNFGKIEGVNLTLGSDITMNYYAPLGLSDLHNAYMKFTRAGEVYYAYPRKGEYSGQYKFSYKGLSPQAIGDTIKAELYIGDELIDTRYYSALENCQNLLEEYPSNVKMKNLIKSLLSYGAAAQAYVGYKTDRPVNENNRVVLSSPTSADSVRYIGSSTDNSLKINALGVYFDSDNKIYVKFTATSLSGVSVSFNGESALIKEFDKANNEYIAYSDSIPVTQFHIPYDIVLTNGSTTQAARYSVNSYAYAKLSSENEAMTELARATYTYGDCAKKYAGIGETIYTVMTYNDADNNAPYEDNYNNVAQIIRDTRPDLIGMQEIQGQQKKNYLWGYVDDTSKKNHAAEYQTIMNEMGYGWIWVSRGASPGGDYEEWEIKKPSGVGIAYNKEKFELLETRHFWLSDTPTVASKYDESDYTADFTAALLEDKATGERLVFVCVHLNYLDQANRKQSKKLMELMESENDYVDYSAYRKIYVGDYNCAPDTQGHLVMNENGYSATEDMLSNAYRPTTASNLSYIDFIFANRTEFRALSYKVLNDHPLAIYTSDHYPVVSRVIATRAYADIPLEEID